MSNASDDVQRGADAVCAALIEAGVDTVIGLPGTQTLPIDRAIAQRPALSYVQAHHETAIPHIAWGHYEAGGQMAATLTVPGPGDTNAMHGLKNALNDGVPIVHIAADVDPADRGKGPIHEIEAETFDNAVKANLVVERPTALTAAVAEGLAIAQSPPTGPVRLGLPSGFLDTSLSAPGTTVETGSTTVDNDGAFDRAIEAVTDANRPLLWVGGGARRSTGGAAAVEDLADRLSAPVVATLKGKGVFPEDRQEFLGVTGSHLPAGARRVLERADTIIAIGTDFDGLSTANWSLPTGETLLQIDIDPAVIGRSYEPDIALVADAATACERLVEGIAETSTAPTWDGPALATAIREEFFEHLRTEGLLDAEPPLSTPVALQELRKALPRETIVTTDVGGFRLWAKQTFEAYAPEQYITAGSWAGMGIGVPGAVGAKLARPDRPVVAITGDGGLLMCLQTLHTAVDAECPLTVAVINDGDYGGISKSPKLDTLDSGRRFAWDSPDFAAIAEGFGCHGERVETVDDLMGAVEDALDRSEVPTLLDIVVDPATPTIQEAADYESTFAIEDYTTD
ncbi:MAG: thiamine pyrophosphate-binding protein [Halobacteriales archaeon]